MRKGAPRLPALPLAPPRIGPFRREFWRSPLRGPWLSSVLGSALLPLIVLCAVTGFLSHIAYDPALGSNSPIGRGRGLDLHLFSWPTSPAWLFAAVQGVHIVSGIAAVPILLAKLWSVIPKLFEHPPLRSLAHALERASLALLVGGSLFVFFTGILNIELYYPWKFSFVPAHYYAAFIFLAALALHVGLKLPVMRRAFRSTGILRPLRDDLAHTTPEPPDTSDTVTIDPAPPTMSRRALLGWIGVASVGLAVTTAGQVAGGPLRPLAFLAPHGRSLGNGPNDFQVNKTAASRGIKLADTGPRWRLKLSGARDLRLSRDHLLALPQHTESLPIACVEGWSTTQSWTGVRLRDLARLAGASDGHELFVESLQKGGAFRTATLSTGQVADARSLLALKVNGADLSHDHGYPARIIVPALPGVLCTKWVSAMKFTRT
jgi:DMSO/TMAO reductase YedYZ molybdopterin-dependent catalytic subunit